VQWTPIWAEALGNRKGMTFLGASSRRCLGRAGRATAVANTGRRASAQSGCPQNLRTAYSLGRLGRLPVGQRRSLPQRYGICAADMTGLVDTRSACTSVFDGICKPIGRAVSGWSPAQTARPARQEGGAACTSAHPAP